MCGIGMSGTEEGVRQEHSGSDISFATAGTQVNRFPFSIGICSGKLDFPPHDAYRSEAPMTPSANACLRGFTFALLAAACIFSFHTKAEDKPPPAPQSDTLDAQFATKVKPFVETYCVSCHGPKK